MMLAIFHKTAQSVQLCVLLFETHSTYVPIVKNICFSYNLLLCAVPRALCSVRGQSVHVCAIADLPGVNGYLPKVPRQFRRNEYIPLQESHHYRHRTHGCDLWSLYVFLPYLYTSSDKIFCQQSRILLIIFVQFIYTEIYYKITGMVLFT